MTDISPLLKVSARLVDLHDSRRTPGESTQYQNEERRGNENGQYVAIAGYVLATLQESGKRSGDEFTSVDSVTQSVRESLHWAGDLDVEYVLNVLSRPTELRLLQYADDVSHVIGDKETNLIEKAAHLSEYRLTHLGRKALSMSGDDSDITYIEGDVIKLYRAVETGRLKHAIGFIDRIIDQLRSEQIVLISAVERTASGRKVSNTLLNDLDGYEAIMRRASESVNKVQGRVDVLARDGIIFDEDIPIGLVRERVRELSRGIVGYARSLSLLATQSLSTTSTSVDAPSFANLALRCVVKPPTHTQTDFILNAMGPSFIAGVVPIGTDFQGAIKSKIPKVMQSIEVALTDFQLPPEDELIEWLNTHQDELNELMQQGELSLQDAVIQELARDGKSHSFGCLVAALTSPNEWLIHSNVQGSLDSKFTISQLPGMAVMFSGVNLKKKGSESPEMDANDSL